MGYFPIKPELAVLGGAGLKATLIKTVTSEHTSDLPRAGKGRGGGNSVLHTAKRPMHPPEHFVQLQ